MIKLRGLWLHLTRFTRLHLIFSVNFACLILISSLCSRVRVDLVSSTTPAPASAPAPTTTPPATLTPQPTATPVHVPVTFSVQPQSVCLTPDLALEAHLSASGSYTETERSASTPMVCHIQRDSCAYHQFLGLLDPTIVFKREEQTPYDVEDILMHPAMILPLSHLNQLVQAEWQGEFQLRVTDAYDSLLEHDPPDSEPAGRYSLHYEGRAIDLTLWPVDQSKYGRLCALAHCAGFDWVKQEGTHCHASIKAESLCLKCPD